ncbi:hypothetical protein SLA2020_273860 [Shorea laevis]
MLSFDLYATGLGQLTNLQTLSKFVVHSGSSNSSDLQELNGLNKLRGELEITNVGHGKGVASECLAANLKEKQHLHSLKLQWSREGDVMIQTLLMMKRHWNASNRTKI